MNEQELHKLRDDLLELEASLRHLDCEVTDALAVVKRLIEDVEDRLLEE